MVILNRSKLPDSSAAAALESQRDSVSKPWVATQELPWGLFNKKFPTPTALRLFAALTTISEANNLSGNILGGPRLEPFPHLAS
jgi:hypothetical protein